MKALLTYRRHITLQLRKSASLRKILLFVILKMYLPHTEPRLPLLVLKLVHQVGGKSTGTYTSWWVNKSYLFLCFNPASASFILSTVRNMTFLS